MTVRELIRELEKIEDKELPVCINSTGYDGCTPDDVSVTTDYFYLDGSCDSYECVGIY